MGSSKGNGGDTDLVKIPPAFYRPTKKLLEKIPEQ